MSEQKINFMATLDEWTEQNIVFPLYEASRAFKKGDVASDEAMHQINAAIKKLVREKVLESYRNGQQAKPTRQWKR